MKILQICSKLPYPPKDGGSVAMNILTEGLLACGNEVHVLAVSTPKHFIDEASIDAGYRKQTNFQSVFIDTDIKPLAALKNLFTGESYNISRFWSAEFERRLISILKSLQYDVVQLETLWVAPYVDTIRKHSKAKVVLRSQNVEFRIWDMLARATPNPLKRRYLHLLSGRLKKYELSMLNRYDAILPITELDLKAFTELGCNIPQLFIPFGTDSARYKVDRSNLQFPSVFHIGAMDWLPNADAIKWILNDVWPLVRKQLPSLKLHLAGRNMPEWMKNISEGNVVVHGEVADSAQFINKYGIMIVPLSSGGGMRVKIIEGMALAKTIVSTTVGAAGIEYTNGKDILIADTAEDFAAAIVKCASDKSFAMQIADNARTLIETRYDNRKICEELTSFYHKLISK